MISKGSFVKNLLLPMMMASAMQERTGSRDGVSIEATKERIRQAEEERRLRAAAFKPASEKAKAKNKAKKKRRGW